MRTIVFASFLLLTTTLAAQTTIQRPLLALEDKFEVAELTLSHVPTREGETVRITMWLRNHSAAPLQIPWSFSREGQSFAGGSVEVPAGGGRIVFANWNVRLGVYMIVGRADPDGTLGDRALGNNGKSVQINLPYPDLEVSSPSFTPSEIQVRKFFDGSYWKVDPASLQLTVVGTIRNRGTAPAVNVLWSLKEGGIEGYSEHSAGTIPRLDPGSSYEIRHAKPVTAPVWDRENRTYHLTAGGVVGEPLWAPGDNSRSAILVVNNFQIATQTVTLNESRSRGAQFSITPDQSGQSCRTSIYETTENRGTGRPPGIPWFRLDCSGSLLGGRAVAEAFKDFPALKNGWLVSEVGGIYASMLPNSSATWEVQPAKGGTSLYARQRMSTAASTSVETHLIITISGPAGTDPYR